MDRNKLSIALITLGTVLIVAAVTMMALVATGTWLGDGDGNSDLETITGFGSIATVTPGPSPTPQPDLPPPPDAPIARLVIPDAEVDAQVVTMGVDAQGVMEAPNNGYDVAWYDFSARPGWGGNAVFAAHVDYYNIGPAVFWHLKDLEQGDIVEIHLTDGTVLRYAVTVKQQYDAATAPVQEIVGPTPTETLTMITCSGTFNSGTSQYDKRLVVRAERIVEPPAALPPGA